VITIHNVNDLTCMASLVGATSYHAGRLFVCCVTSIISVTFAACCGLTRSMSSMFM
jgi:hypothetical protein